MSEKICTPTFNSGQALARMDRGAELEPRYTHGFNGLRFEDRSPFVQGYLDLVEGDEWR